MSRIVCPACGGPETTTPGCPRCEGSGLITMNTEIDQLTSKLRQEKALRTELQERWKQASRFTAEALDLLEKCVKETGAARHEAPELYEIGELLMDAYSLKPSTYSPFLAKMDDPLGATLTKLVGMIERIDRRLTSIEDQQKADRITADIREQVTG